MKQDGDSDAFVDRVVCGGNRRGVLNEICEDLSESLFTRFDKLCLNGAQELLETLIGMT